MCRWSFAQPSSLVLSLSSCLNQRFVGCVVMKDLIVFFFPRSGWSGNRFILCKLDSPCYDIVSGIINIPIPMAA
ncbi:hypothetical protein V6N12_047543 [Hibiscus sabdariffa]|uniref:Secreted protein n=1 Tax=Hibiscus sabdariffa TaxID=183260 RepID=A0ABR2DB63_9ROSI